MNEVLRPPAERDLPPRRAARMRAELLAATAGPRPRPVRRRLLVAAAAAAVVTLAAGVAVTSQVRQDDRTQILAMSTGEQDKELRAAVRQCLSWADDAARRGDDAVQVTAADVAVAARRGHEAAVLFVTDTGYYGCEVVNEPGSEITGGFDGGRWPHRDWLPGPVQTLSMTSSQPYGGAVSVLGRVSARVDRLVLEHGAGRTTTARLHNGTFGLISRTADVRRKAELVSYDATGQEIDRRSLFELGEYPHCYTDPTGKILFGGPGTDCVPADPWTR
jgi:hypothetical protein